VDNLLATCWVTELKTPKSFYNKDLALNANVL